MWRFRIYINFNHQPHVHHINPLDHLQVPHVYIQYSFLPCPSSLKITKRNDFKGFDVNSIYRLKWDYLERISLPSPQNMFCASDSSALYCFQFSTPLQCLKTLSHAQSSIPRFPFRNCASRNGWSFPSWEPQHPHQGPFVSRSHPKFIKSIVFPSS